MRIQRKTLPAAVCAVIVLMLTVSMALAAYYGKGNFKDVFVNRKNCFTSDRLAPISQIEDAEKNGFQAANGRIINIYNYDISTGEYNAFDMTFSLYAWLDRDSRDASTEYYELQLGDQPPKRISTADHTQPIFKDIPLAGKEASECGIKVSFNTEADLSDYPKLCIYAIPTQPDYMMQKQLGGCLTPTDRVGFTAMGQFDILTDDLEDYAAFPYEVTMSGRLDGKTGYLKIMWDPANLTLMTRNNSLPEAITVQTEEGQQCIRIPLAEEYYARLTFLRVQDAAEDAENPWTAGTVSREELESFVTYICEYT